VSREIMQKIESLIPLLSEEEKRRLACQLGQSTDTVCQPKSLLGIWKDKFPPTFDVENELKEIRSAWLEDMEEMTRG